MSLQNHFRPPLSVRRHWHSFHPSWATVTADSARRDESTSADGHSAKQVVAGNEGRRPVRPRDAGATVLTVLQRLGIDTGTVHGVMVNDEMELDRNRPLADAASLVSIPPVGGG